MGALALFLVIAGGTAYAANTVGSSDIINNQVFSADVRDDTLAGGGLGHVDLKAGSVRSSEVGADSLTGADIANQSGVDTCVSTIRIGQLCFRAENQHRNWITALLHCANLDLRLPTVGEAFELARTHDLPNVDEAEGFWTEEFDGNDATAVFVRDDSVYGDAIDTQQFETVCVTTPTN